MTDIVVPQLGESVTEATVGQWLKKAGDKVSKDEVLVELETDKVSVEVPAPAAGVLAEIVAPEGTTVDATAKLAVISSSGAVVAATPAAAAPAPSLDALWPMPIRRRARLASLTRRVPPHRRVSVLLQERVELDLVRRVELVEYAMGLV